MEEEGLLFMQVKEKESLFRNKNETKRKSAYFLSYVFGLMFYGMGSYLFLNDLLLAKIDVLGNTNLFSILGLLSSLAGIGILIFLFYQFYKRVADKRKIRIALRNYLLFLLITGVLFGLLGESIYRITDRSYDWVKNFIWVLTTYFQGITRFIFLYYCLTLLKNEAFSWKKIFFKKKVLVVFLLLSVSIGVSLFLPAVGSLVQFLVDMVVAIGIVYIGLFQTKKIN